MQNFVYKAFISYSHADHKCAEWLHKALEAYRIPKHVQHSTELSRLRPIFRDRAELPANADLSEAIKAALAGSEYLIVLCSPAAAASQWVNAEILEFKRLYGETRILSVIVAGVPFSADHTDECFPPALRFLLGADGTLSQTPCEPIAADLRDGGDGKRLAKLKLVAGMLGVGLDRIVQRDIKRRQRAMTFVTVTALGAMLVMGYLTWSAIDSRRQAEARQAESEDLVAFMLGDLRQKLEPVGRLDVLGAVSGKVLAHYARDSARTLSDSSLQQKAKALTLLGDIESQRGDKKSAYATLQQASAVTGELVRRQPNNQQYIFDHAQNEFWRGQVMLDSGNNAAADQSYKNYETLAQRLVSLTPKNPKWQLEVAYALINRGALLLEENQPQPALVKFEQALQIQEKMPSKLADRTWLKEKANTLVWKADALRRLLRLHEATAVLDTEILMYQNLLKHDPKDEQINGDLQSARVNQALTTAATGNVSGAISDLDRAIKVFGYLVQHDPENQDWRERLVSTQQFLTEILLDNNQTARAIVILDRIKNGIATFEQSSKNNEFWQQKLKTKNLCLIASLYVLQKHYTLAADILDIAIENSTHTQNTVKTDDMVPRNIGFMFYMRGEISKAMKDRKTAQRYWKKAYQQLEPYKLTGEARDRDTLARAAFRLGYYDEAFKAKTQLDHNDFRYPAYLKFWNNALPEAQVTQHILTAKEKNDD